MKKYLYQVMEESPDGNGAALSFNYFMTFLIIINVFAVILETVEPLHQQYLFLFSAIDIISIAFFTVEYFVRLWICTLNPAYSDPVRGRLRYMVSAFALIDLLSFLPFYIPFVIPVDLRFLRILRLFRLIRVMKLGRYSEAMKTFHTVIAKTKEQLILTLSILFIVLVIASSLMFYAEHDAQPDKFASIPNAMWWAVVTLATVGYGDIYPVTALGKVIGGVVVVTGIAIFALPAAILSAGFIEEMQDRKVVICPSCGHRIGSEAGSGHEQEKPGNPRP
jgi:voltage-gated potassium channel